MASQIRAFLAERGTRLGTPLAPEDVTVILAPSEFAGELVLFRARYGGGERETWLSGVTTVDQVPTLEAPAAIALVFARSLAQGPAAASPVRLARAIGFLLDPEDRFQVILTADDIARVDWPDWRPLVHVPVPVEGGIARGLIISCVSPAGPTELRIIRDANGGIQMTEKRVLP